MPRSASSALRWFEERLIRSRIDREEVIALFHEVAFAKHHVGDDAGDLRTNADGLERFDVANRGHLDWNIALLDRGDGDRNGAAFAAATTASPAAASAIGSRRRGVGAATRGDTCKEKDRKNDRNGAH